MKHSTQKGNSNETKANPWKGLVPYQDGDKCLFCGRERETEELSEIVRQNTIVTLYGRSGVGKTSLLQAGIFPIMRFFGYKPIPIRLSTERNAGESFISCIIRIMRGFYKSNSKSSNLRDFLGSIDCDDDNKPLIILDQFEEVLRDAKDDATSLLKELRALLSKNSATHFRVIISLREDDLYRLEDLLDRNHIDQLKRTRYRIRDIDFEGCQKIIKYPAQKADLTIEDGVVEALIEKIQNDDSNNQTTADTRSNETSTLLLSLYLNRLYNKTRHKRAITISDINTLGKRPLYNYYSDATKGLSLHKKTIIAKMAPGGYRLPKSESELKAILGSKFDALTKGDNRIFNIASGSKSNNEERKWELVHDRLAKNIYDTLSERKVKRNKVIIILLAAAFIVGIAVTSLVLGINRNATKPIPFRTEDYIGKTVEWQGRPFEIENGHLKLTNCTVEPYTFIDVIDTLTIGDSVVLKGNAIETSRLRHINIEGKFHGLFFDQGSFDSLKSINIGPNASPYYVVSNMTPHCTDIQSVTIAPGNYSFIYSNGTLWFNVNGLKPIISRNKTVLCEDIYQSDSKRYTRIDIARDSEKMQNSRDCNYIFLTCSDSTKNHISAKDIPAGAIVGIDMPWVTEIDADVFKGNTFSCQKIKLPRLTELGDNNFIWGMNELDSITLPDSIHVTSIYTFCPFYSGERRTARLLKGTIFTYNNDTTSYCAGKYGMMKKYVNTRTTTDQPDDTCGYHYDANRKIVFDSDIVSSFNIGSDEIDYDSLTIIPRIIHHNNNGSYKIENYTLMYYRDNAFRPALILRTDEPVLIQFKDTLHEKAFGATSYELYWPIRYNIPSGDTLYVPSGQTDFYKRLYGNGYTFKELSRRKTRRNAKMIRNKALNEGGKLKDRTLTIGAHTERVSNEYTDSTFFDRPIVTDIDIDWRNTFFSIHGNVLYRNESPIRSINNGKPVVLNGLSSLGSKKIHKGEYVLLQADALFPDPALSDSASLYTFYVPKGTATDYHLLAEQGCRIEELSSLQTFRYRLAEWWNKHILIITKDGGTWFVHQKSILAWTIYIFIVLVSTIISGKIIKKKTDLKRSLRTLVIALMVLAAAIIALAFFLLLTQKHFSAYISTAIYLTLFFAAASIWRHKVGGKWCLTHNATALMVVTLIGSLCSCSNNTDTKPSRIYPNIKGNRLGFVDAKGKTVVPYKYCIFFKTDAHGNYIITDFASFTTGIIDSTGKTIVPCRFDSFNSAFVKNKNGTCYSILEPSAVNRPYRVYNSSLRMILSHSERPIAVESENGLFFRIVQKNDDTIYYDTTGAVTAAPEGAKVVNYDIRRIPLSTISLCNLTITQQDGAYGVADTNGNTIIPCIYDKIERMYISGTDIFHLYKDGRQGVADALGRQVYPLKKDVDIGSLGSCFCVTPYGHTYPEFRTSLYDSHGKRILKKVRTTIFVHGDGMRFVQRRVRFGTRYYIIGNDGDIIVGRCRIAYTYNSGGEEVVEFRKHGRTGRLIKNNNGEWEPKWYK